MMNRWRKSPPWVWLLLIMGVATTLRLISIGRDSLWFDEAISYLAAALPVPDILNNTVQSSHPPLYYLSLHIWLIFMPDSDIALKLLSVLWNVLLIPAIYLLTVSLFNRRGLALAAAGLVAISPFHILYSHELRMYTQLMLLVTLCTWAYWEARQTMRWRWWVLFGLLSLAAVYTHLFAFLVLAGTGLHALYYHKNRPALWRTSVIIFLILILFMPWLTLILGETQKDLGSLRPLTAASVRNPIKPLTSLVFLLFGMSSSFVYSGFAYFVTLAISAILVLEARRMRREGTPEGVVLIGLILMCECGIPVLVYLVRPFFLPERTMAAASPYLIIFLAWSLTRRQSPLPHLVGLSSVVMLAGSLLYLGGPSIKPPYQAVSQYVAEHKLANDAVLHTSDGSYLPALRYTPYPQHAILAGDPDPRKPVSVYQAIGGQVWSLEDAATKSDRLWLVVATEHSIDWQLKQAAVFENRYQQLEMHSIGHIQIRLYQMSDNNIVASFQSCHIIPQCKRPN